MIRIDSFGTGDPAAMSRFKVLMAGLAVVVLWASAFPAIRVAAPDLGVIGLSVVRLAVASLALLAVAPLAHVRLPERRQLALLVAAAFFGMTAYQSPSRWHGRERPSLRACVRQPGSSAHR